MKSFGPEDSTYNYLLVVMIKESPWNYKKT